MKTQEAFGFFYHKLNEIQGKCFPLETLSITYDTRHPWLTDSLRDGINTLRPRQNGRHFADDTFKRIFVNKNVWNLIEISLKFVPRSSSSIPKFVLPSMCSHLTHICNLSVQEDTFPNEMRIAYVPPLFKSDDPEIFYNYRAVSVLCSLSKIFETVRHNRVIDYLNKCKILFWYQFRFLKCHSTYMSLMVLMDK